MRSRWGTLRDAGLDALGAAVLGAGLAIPLALLLDGGDSVREQLVAADTSAERESAKRTPGRCEEEGAMDTMGC